VAPRHGLGEKIAAQTAGESRGNRRIEEEPRVSAVARSGSLDGYRQLEQRAGLRESGDVFLPSSLVEVDGEKPTGLVLEKRVHADDMTAAQMVVDYLVVNRLERLIRTLAALDARLLADTSHPLVRAGWRVASRAFVLIDPETREHIRTAAKQRTEEIYFVSGRTRGRPRRRRCRGHGRDDWRGRSLPRRAFDCRQLVAELVDPSLQSLVRAREGREFCLGLGNLVDERPRIRHDQ
jgi:hypothetical protein